MKTNASMKFGAQVLEMFVYQGAGYDYARPTVKFYPIISWKCNCKLGFYPQLSTWIFGYGSVRQKVSIE